ncbi:putative ribonuclease H-like domain-containing protein [Tanacetum coccineum]
MVAQGYNRGRGLDYDEVFAPVARIEAIRIFLAFASYMGFIVYQMDVKSAFLYGTIDEEVYVSQPPGFVDPKFPKKVYKVVKALYGLHQAPRAWYATLSTFLLKSGYRRGTIDKTLFIKKDKNDIMLVQVYVDDIIFGSTKRGGGVGGLGVMKFVAINESRFKWRFYGRSPFFLGLQVKQKEDGIFISQDKYVAEILKKFDFTSVKTASTPIETQKPLTKDKEADDVDVTPKTSHLHAVKRIFRYLKGKPKLCLWYPRVSSFDLEAYSNSDYAGANLDKKSTTGEAEYVAAANCCGQVLWIQNQMFDRLDLVELYNLVMQRFETITPEGVDLVLWGDLRTMFDANAEDELWQNQERWNLKSWNFYENCGVHTLTLEDGTEIHMLAERKYPLTKETLERMMSLKLIAESASDSAYDLLRFIQKQIDEAGSHDGGEKDL